MNHGLIFPTCLDGKKSSFFTVASIPQRNSRTLHKISPSKPLFLTIISISKVGHILDERRAVSWVKHLMFQMLRFDDQGIGIHLVCRLLLEKKKRDMTTKYLMD